VDFHQYVREHLPPLAIAREPEIVDELAQHLSDLYAEARDAGLNHEAALASASAALPEYPEYLAREIESEPDLIIAVQPTRGLDVGAIESVHRLLMARRAAGAAILLITEELDEIMSLADRVDVIYEGRVVGSFPVDSADIEQIGLLMTGGEEASVDAPAAGGENR